MKNFMKIVTICSALGTSAAVGQTLQPANVCEQTILLGVRTDAPPFSYRITQTQIPQDSREMCGHSTSDILRGYAGYTIEMCRGFIRTLRDNCDARGPEIEVVEVSVNDRYTELSKLNAEFDMLCGATTATISLGAMIPRSPYTFLTSASALVNNRFNEKLSCKLGVVQGTTSDPGTQDAVADPRRLETWQSFTQTNSHCQLDDLNTAEPFPSTLDAILALQSSSETAQDGQIDVLIGDHHVLHWYWRHLGELEQRMSLDPEMRMRIAELAPAEGSSETGLAALRAELRLIPAAISIEPYAVVGPRGSELLLAEFSQYLARQQQDDGGQYTTLLRRCFGRQVDRSFWFLAELQSKMRDGNPLPLETTDGTGPSQ